MEANAQMTRIRRSNSPLCGRRILICGKGGSGKSTVVALMANVDRLE
jgi:ABC-type lipoprotein export system ATPase subunit